MTPKELAPSRRLVVWPCRVSPDLLKSLQQWTEKEQKADPRMSLGLLVERELRKALKLHRRNAR